MYNVQGVQKICDVLVDHPSWNLAHLAAYFGLYDAFKDPRINNYLNSTDDETGISPLQVAITTKNLKTVQMLVAANGSLEHVDFNGNSVYHYAASTTKDIISVSVPNVCCHSKMQKFFSRLSLREPPQTV